MKIYEKIRNSLFLKIILLFIIAHAIIITVGITMHRHFNVYKHHTSLTNNMEHHSKYIAAEIIANPDTNFVCSLSDSLHIGMLINTAQLKWQSDDSLPDFLLDPDQGIQSKTYLMDGKSCIELVSENGHFLFVFDTGINRGIDTLKWRIIVPIVLMMFILTVLYYIIRFILKPIRDLDEAAKKLGDGQLDLNLQTKRRDELGDLVNSFNFMTTRIKDMLKARDHLLLDASHELRSPLTRSKVALELLEDSSVKQNIKDDIQEMETMITELLESERLDSPHGGLHLQEIDIVEMLRQISEEYQNIPPGIEIQSDKQALFLQADPERLKMALANLIQNAIKYSEPNGKPVHVSVSENEQGTIIIIQDFGRGIPSEDQQFVFEPFYRVDKSRAKDTGGYGLGLSLTKKIIETHKAGIELKSIPGEGSTFTLKF